MNGINGFPVTQICVIHRISDLHKGKSIFGSLGRKPPSAGSRVVVSTPSCTGRAPSQAPNGDGTGTKTLKRERGYKPKPVTP